MDSTHILKYNLLTKLVLAATLSLSFVASTNITKPNANVSSTVQAAHKGDIKDGKFHYLYKNHKKKVMADLTPGNFYLYNYKGRKINVKSLNEEDRNHYIFDKDYNVMNGVSQLAPNGYRYINGEKYWHIHAKDSSPLVKSTYMRAADFNAKTNKLYGHPGIILYQTSAPIKCYSQESPDENGHVNVTNEDYAQTIPAGGMIIMDISPYTTNYKRETNKDVVYANTDGRYDYTHQTESIMIKKSDWDKYVHVAPGNARYYDDKVSKGYMTNGLLKKGYVVSPYNGKKMKMYQNVWNFNVVSGLENE